MRDLTPVPDLVQGAGAYPGEGVCNRAELDSAVSVHPVERFRGDLATANRDGRGPAWSNSRGAMGADSQQTRTGPETAARLADLAQQEVHQRWTTYEEMAARGFERFPAADGSA
jgi:hypothetical protein